MADPSATPCATNCGQPAHDAMLCTTCHLQMISDLNSVRAGLLDMIATPAQGNRLELVPWIADNGCFGGGYPGDDAWIGWLRDNAEHASRCRFAVAPDVVADAAATLERSAPWLRRVRSLGYPVALVAQDGLEQIAVPWGEFDALFIGGTTAWKLSRHAERLAAEAKRRGHWVHMGRVNSHRRLRRARDIGCDSVDGTLLAFGPDRNLSQLLGWLRELDAQPALWDSEATA